MASLGIEDMDQELKGFGIVVNEMESYFGHNCTVLERKSDVLKTDIPSSNRYLTKLRRWWFGLFLVSFSDERSKIYYKSTEAIRSDRIRQFRFYKRIVHPLSKIRSFWDCLMLALFTINEFVIHHNLSYVHGKMLLELYYVGPIIEVINIFDVLFNSRSGYIDCDAKIVIEKSEILKHYCSTKLFLHVASAIPVQWTLILRHGSNVACDLCKTNIFVFTLKAFTIFRVFRIYEYSTYLTRERKHFVVTSLNKFLRIFILASVTMLYFQDIADGSTLLQMIRASKITNNSYVGIILSNRYRSDGDPQEKSKYLYGVSILRALRMPLGVHFFSVDFHMDRLATILSYIVTSFFYMWSISEMHALVTRLHSFESNINKYKKNAESLVYSRNLTDAIIPRLNEYYDCKKVQMNVLELNNILYESMPQSLKNEITLTCYRRSVKRVPYFAEWPADVLEALVLMLTRETYLCSDMVAEPGVQSEGLAIVAAGEMAVYSGQEELGHLIDGDYFGELSLVTDRERRTTSIFAVTTTVVLMLDQINFRHYMRNHQDLFLQLKHSLENN